MADRESEVARRGRIAAIVIAAGGVLALIAPVLPVWLGVAQRYEILVYLIALAAFVWALVETFSIWQIRRKQ